MHKHCGLVTREQLYNRGWSKSAVSRACKQWRSLLPGVYLTDAREVSDEVCGMAALLRWPDAVLSHTSAAKSREWPVLDQSPKWSTWLGSADASFVRSVHVTAQRWIRPSSGYVMHQSSPGPTVYVRDFRITDEVRTLLDVARCAPLPVSVVMLDAVLAKSPWLMSELCRSADSLSGHRNIARAQGAIHLSTLQSESVLESLLRLLIILAGLPPPQLQIPVHHPRGTYYADMGYREIRLLIEADGFDHHSERRKVGEDLVRQNAMVAAGWRVLRFTWAQVLYQPEMVIAAIRAALSEQPDH
jgi:very-short-patch-repair endonuclease